MNMIILDSARLAIFVNIRQTPSDISLYKFSPKQQDFVINCSDLKYRQRHLSVARATTSYYSLRLVLRQQLLEVHADGVRGRRAQLGHAFRAVRVRAREAGTRHYGVRTGPGYYDCFVALDLRRCVWVCNKG